MKKSPLSVKKGDIFRIGDHVIGCGDSRDKEFVAKLVGERTIKAVVTDPPFGIAVVESAKGFKKLKKSEPIEGDHLQTDSEYTKFTRDWIEAVAPYLERKNTFHIFAADRMVFALREGMREAGMKFAQLLVWVKTSSIIGRLDYSPQHELIVYGWHGVHEFPHAQDKSVIVYPKPSKSPRHPTTKPVGLIRRFVFNASRVSETVYDGFLGSGTTIHACQQTGRCCIGAEISPAYVSAIIDDCERLYQLKAKRV